MRIICLTALVLITAVINSDVLKYMSYDLDAIVEEIKSWDGYGNNLARYDGKEHEQDGFYIFRQG